MMRSAWLAALLFSSVSWAGSPDSFLVKIRCFNDHLGIRFEGSGILVQHQKSAYILTSEHVVLHDNDLGTDLEFHLDGQKTQKMTYINSDWGMGLALMKAPDELASDELPKLEDLAQVTSPAAGDPVFTVGFPARSESLVFDDGGKVSSTSSPSMVLADIEKLLEVKQAQGEFGMSGGAVLNSSYTPIGVLSHEKSGPSSKTLYAIPISQAARWAMHFITDPNAKPRLVRTTSDFLEDENTRVRTGHLIISWDPGSDSAHPKNVQVRWEKTAEFPSHNPPTESYPAALFDQITQRYIPLIDDGGFSRFQKTTVKLFRPRDLLKSTEMKEPSSLVEFFRMLNDPKLKPMARYTSIYDYDVAPFPFEYCSARSRLKNFVERYQNEFSNRAMTEKLRQVLIKILDLTQCQWTLEEIQWGAKYPVEALNREDIDRLLNGPDFAEDWAKFKAHGGIFYPGIRDSLQEIGEVLAKLNI